MASCRGLLWSPTPALLSAFLLCSFQSIMVLSTVRFDCGTEQEASPTRPTVVAACSHAHAHESMSLSPKTNSTQTSAQKPITGDLESFAIDLVRPHFRSASWRSRVVFSTDFHAHVMPRFPYDINSTTAIDDPIMIFDRAYASYPMPYDACITDVSLCDRSHAPPDDWQVILTHTLHCNSTQPKCLGKKKKASKISNWKEKPNIEGP